MESFPFSAVVGSDDLALALVLTTVAPEVGGVLVRGEKGTAKTTMVRALADVLPPIMVVESCRFSCDPTEPDPLCPDGPHLQSPSASRPARARPQCCSAPECGRCSACSMPRHRCSAPIAWSQASSSAVATCNISLAPAPPRIL